MGGGRVGEERGGGEWGRREGEMKVRVGSGEE